MATTIPPKGSRIGLGALFRVGPPGAPEVAPGLGGYTLRRRLLRCPWLRVTPQGHNPEVPPLFRELHTKASTLRGPPG